MTRSRSLVLFVITGLAAALLLVFLVAPHASSAPDGLEKVAADQHLDTGQQVSPSANSPLADYAVRGVHDSALSTGVAGAVGVGVTFALSFGLVVVLRHRRARPTAASAPT